jgi:hypothetical protein
MPVGVLGLGLTKGKLKELDHQYAMEQNEDTTNISCKAKSMMSSSSVWKPRSKTETPEERLERKKAIKEYRRVSSALSRIRAGVGLGRLWIYHEWAVLEAKRLTLKIS